MKTIRAGGGVVFRRENNHVQVLMIRRRGVWDLPKGKIEMEESAEEGACREVEEETGCRGVRIRFSLGVTHHTYTEGREKVQKTTNWYAMEADTAELKPQEEEQIDSLEWMEVEKAITSAHFENLKEVLTRFASGIKKC